MKINCNFKKEANGNAKLTALEVAQIRNLYKKGGTSHRALAAQFGICKTHVRRIIKGESWS